MGVSYFETYFTTFHSTLSRICLKIYLHTWKTSFPLCSQFSHLQILSFPSCHQGFHWIWQSVKAGQSWPSRVLDVDVDPSTSIILRYKRYHPWDWYISLHLVDFYGFHVGKYTSPMDTMGYRFPLKFTPLVTSGKSIGWIITDSIHFGPSGNEMTNVLIDSFIFFSTVIHGSDLLIFAQKCWILFINDISLHKCHVLSDNSSAIAGAECSTTKKTWNWNLLMFDSLTFDAIFQCLHINWWHECTNQNKHGSPCIGQRLRRLFRGPRLAAGEINLPEFKAVMLASLRRSVFRNDYESTNLKCLPSWERSHIPYRKPHVLSRWFSQLPVNGGISQFSGG